MSIDYRQLNDLRLDCEQAEREALAAWFDRTQAQKHDATGEHLQSLQLRELRAAYEAGQALYRYGNACQAAHNARVKREKQAQSA